MARADSHVETCRSRACVHTPAAHTSRSSDFADDDADLRRTRDRRKPGRRALQHGGGDDRSSPGSGHGTPGQLPRTATRSWSVARTRSRYVTVAPPGGAARRHRVTVGVGTIVLAAIVATASVAIGSHVVLMPQVVLTMTNIVSDFTTIASGSCSAAASTSARAPTSGRVPGVHGGCRSGPGPWSASARS